MDLRHYSILRVISLVVLFFFSWTFGGLFDVAIAAKASSELRVPHSGLKNQKAEKPEEKFEKAIEGIENIIKEVGKVGRLEDEKKEKLKNQKAEIEALDVEIRKQFAETEKRLKNAKLPDKILQRHYDFVKQYEENLEELITNLEAIEKHSAESIEFEEAIKKTKAHLEKIKPPKKHVPLDPNKLPHRTAEPTKKKPRLKKEDFGIEQSAKGIAQRQKPILVASNGSLTGILTRNPQPATRNSELQFSKLQTPNSELAACSSRPLDHLRTSHRCGFSRDH